ncbi:uncharacterized protein LOC128211585 isoform X2 [Mya arenaria]|uniref:uncharacterized protein LOC128211585 isoform X2 n=1 Tax=Mya arenaria TaxID=6604 RepID=UPI0022E36940|nr:uncharacterized protein LOC128211585 isoform X2 [Mya arenaria]
MARNEIDRLPFWISPVVEYTFFICQMSSETQTKYENAFDQYALQYFVTLKRGIFAECLAKHGIVCEIVNQDRTILLHCPDDRSPDTIYNILNELLKRKCNDYAIDLQAPDGDKFSRQISNKGPMQVIHGSAIVIKHDTKIICVSESIDCLDRLLVEIGYNEVELLDIKQFGPNLSLLGIQDVCLHPNIQNISVQHRQHTYSLEWKGRAIKKGDVLIREFLKSCSERNIEFVEGDKRRPYTELACKVIFDTDGDINQCYDMYLKRTSTSKKICTHFSLVQKDGRLVLYGRDGDVDILKNNVEGSISKHNLEKKLFTQSDVLSFLEKNKEKLWYDTRTGALVCTTDLSQEVEDLCTRITLTEVFKVNPAADDRKIFMPVDNHFLEGSSVQSIMGRNKCSLSLHANQPKAAISRKDLLKRWVDPYGSTQIWVAEMGTEIPCVDICIVFTADMLRHLGISNPISDEGNSETSEEGYGKKKTFYGPFPFANACICCREIHLVGVKMTENKRLMECFVKEITCSRDKGTHRLGIVAAIGENQEESACGYVISQFVNAVREVLHLQRPTYTQDVYIVVDKRQILEAEENIEIYLSGTFKVFRREKYHAATPFKGKTIEIKLIQGSITKSSSDAIVSTTSTYLDLSNGSTNIDISRADGRELRNEYKVFYPEGIEKGIIAFCQTHRLKKEKVKFILLGVLDKYIFQSFEANVKTFVKSCLFLAEELECRSVSFPAIGVETLKYPRRETIAFVLDAIDAYKLEVKHSDITKVNIVCAEKDRKTIDAFNAAEERRRPDSCMASPEKGQRSFKGQTIVSSYFHSANVTIVPVDEYSYWPSFAVHVKFSKELKGKKAQRKDFQLKKAIDDPVTWNDEIHFKTIESLMTGHLINQLKGFLNDERITFLIWNLDSKLRMPYSDQIVLTVSSLETMLKPGNCYLQNVVILLDDNSAIESLHTRINIDSTISWHLSLNEAASESLEMIGRTPECALEATKEVLQLIAETKNSQKSSKSQTDMGSQKDTDAFQDYEKKNKIKTNGSPSVMSESTPGRQKQGSVRDKKFLKGDGQQTEPLGSSSSTGFSGIEATNKAPENTGKNENNTEGDNPHTIAPQKEKPVLLSQGTILSGGPGKNNERHDKFENYASASEQSGIQNKIVQTRGQENAGNAYICSPSVGPGPSGDTHDDPADQPNIGQGTRTNADVKERLEEEPFHDKQESLCFASAPIKQTGYAGKGKSQNQGKVSLTKRTECSLNVDYELNDGCSDNKHLKEETKKETYNAPEMQADFLFRKTANTEADFQNNPSSNAIRLHGASKHQDIEISQDSYSGLQIKSKCSYCDTQKHSSECSKTNGTYTFSKEGGHWCILDAKSDELLTVLDSEADDIYFKGMKLVVVDGTFHKITEDNGVVELQIVHRQSSASKTYHNQLHSSTKGRRSKSAEQFQADIENNVASKQDVLPPSPQIRKKNWTRAWNKDQTLGNPLGTDSQYPQNIETESTQIGLTPSGGRELPRVYGEDDATR